MEPALARSAIDPLTHWMPPALMVVFMFAFAFAWWRAQARAEAKREAAEADRYTALKNAMSGLTDGFTEMRLALANFVTIDRHTASMTTIHEKVNEHGKLIAVLLDRNHRDRG